MFNKPSIHQASSATKATLAAAHKNKIFFHAVHQAINVGYKGKPLDEPTLANIIHDIREIARKWSAAGYIDTAYVTDFYEGHALLAVEGACPQVCTIDLNGNYVSHDIRDSMKADLLKQLGRNTLLNFDWLVYIDKHMETQYGK